MEAPLSGVRIWLSGSVPNDVSEIEAERLLEFVKELAEKVFLEGGTLLHGSHPSLTGTLLDVAEGFKENTNDKAPLGLFVSRLFSKDLQSNNIDLERWRELCGEDVKETPEAMKTDDTSDEDHRDRSLAIMRESMLLRCNAIIAIGGRWWDVRRSKAGVPDEINLAKQSALPLFLLGGMGGAVAGLLEVQPEILRDCANGLSIEANEQLAEDFNPQNAVETTIQQLKRIKRLLLRSIDPKDVRPFRILSLDGGGIRGAYTAGVLAYWEKALQLHQQNGLRIVDHFDLIAGTSTGAILAVGLGMGMSAQEMLQFYQDKGEEIFGSGEGLNQWWHSIRHWFTSKFEQGNLQDALQEAYERAPVAQQKNAQNQPLMQHEWFDNSACRLVIAAYDTKTDFPYLFRTPHGLFNETDCGRNPVNVALASAAAPTYFDPVKIKSSVGDVEVVDGGLWANNPVTVAIGEATDKLQIPFERIQVLSIGTTYTTGLSGQPMLLDGRTIEPFLRIVLGAVGVPFAWIYGKLVRLASPTTRVKGVLGWVANIAGLLMKSQAQTSDLIARQLLKARYVRVDSPSQYGELDDVKNIDYFIRLGERAAQGPESASVESLFLNGIPADPWK